MELHLTTVLPKERSEFAQRVVEKLCNLHDPLELESYLTELPMDVQRLVDLYDWKEALVISYQLLEQFSVELANFGSTDASVTSNPHSSRAVKALLKFHAKLLKAAKDKRHYLSFSVVENLLRCTDWDVVELCLELLFQISVPSSSISANAHDDWMDAIEIPASTATVVNVLFQHLSLKTPDFGVCEYLRGNKISAVNVEDSSMSMEVSGSILKAFPVDNFDCATSLGLQAQHGLGAEDAWRLILSGRVLSGFEKDVAFREQLVRMRMYCLFVLIHAKISPTELQEYVRAGSPFLLDLVALSDIGSETLSALTLTQPLKIAHLALENVLGLLESKLKRRSCVYISSDVDSVLNLMRVSSAEAANTAGDEVWSSIVTSAAIFSTLLVDFNEKDLAKSTSMLLHFEGGVSNHFADIGKFVRLGLELYALALMTRESTNVVTDIRLVSVIVGLLKTLLEQLPLILQSVLASADALDKTHPTLQVLLVITKSLYCLELTADRSGYLVALRECDGMAALGQIIDVFSAVSDRIEELSEKCPTACNILETALSVMQISIRRYRHHHAEDGGGNAADSGHRLAYTAGFLSLGRDLFRDISWNTDTLWIEYLFVLKETIDIDPAFVSTFLTSDVATAIKKAFNEQLPFVRDSREKKLDVDRMFLPLSRFILSICITNESKVFIEQSGIVSFVLSGLHREMSMVPHSAGLSKDRITKIGRSFHELIQVHDNVRNAVVANLKMTLKQLCAEVIEAGDDADWVAVRLPKLQKLTTFCVFFESMVSENRRYFSNVIKEVVTESISSLFKVFRYTLPAARMLFAQMSARSVQSISYGYGYCSKMVGALLKLNISLSPQQGVTLLLEEVDAALNSVVAARRALAHVGVASQDEVTPLDGSLDIAGVLNEIPNVTILREDILSVDENALQRQALIHSFLVSTLNLDWLCALLVFLVKAVHKTTPSPFATSAVIPRLFSFFQSSMTEVCRCAADSMGSKKLTESRLSKGLLEGFGLSDAPNDPTDRVPATYVMRVIGTDGALIREDIEIDTSRIVFVAELGTVFEASERIATSGGLVRLRTRHGWISEFRRDANRTFLLEILDIRGKAVTTSLSLQDKKLNDVSLLLTVREGVVLNLSRLHTTLRQATISLARVGIVGVSAANAAEPSAAQATQLLTAVANSIESVSLSCSIATITAEEQHCSERAIAAKALLLGSLVKTVILPVAEEKNGNLNVNLLFSLLNRGMIQSIFDALVSFGRIAAREIESSVASSADLSAVGQCAMSAFASVWTVVKRFALRDVLSKSLHGVSAVRDDRGHSVEPEKFLQSIMRITCAAALQLLQDSVLRLFPLDLQAGMLELVCDLCKIQKTPSVRGEHGASLFSRGPRGRDPVSEAVRSYGMGVMMTIERLSGEGYGMHDVAEAIMRCRSVDVDSVLEVLQSLGVQPLQGQAREYAPFIPLSPVFAQGQAAAAAAPAASTDAAEASSVLAELLASLQREFARQMCVFLRESVVCETWGGGTTAPQFFQRCLHTLVKMKTEFPSFALDALLNDLLGAAQRFVDGNGESEGGERLYGPLSLLALMVKSGSFSAEFKEVQLARLVLSLLHVLEVHVSSSSFALQRWCGSAIVLATEVSQTLSVGEDGGAVARLRALISSGSGGGGEEKEEDMSRLVESKTSCEGEAVGVDARALRRALFDAVLALLRQGREGGEDNAQALSGDDALATTYALSALLDDQLLADEFVSRGALDDLLRLRPTAVAQRSDELAVDLGAAVSVVLGKCVRTHAEIRREVWSTVTILFAQLPTNEKSLPLSAFLSGLAALLTEYPDDFLAVCRDGLVFTNVYKQQQQQDRNGDASAASAKAAEVRVALRNGSSFSSSFLADHFSSDKRAVTALRTVLTFVNDRLRAPHGNEKEKVEEEEKVRGGCSAADALHALCESALTTKKAAALLSAIFVEIPAPFEGILESIFKVDKEKEKDSKGKKTDKEALQSARAATRLVLVLVGVAGPSRAFVLDELATRLRTFCESENGENDAENDTKTALLCELLLLVLQATRHRDNRRVAQRGVCLETVQLLLRRANVLELLGDTLMRVDVRGERGGRTAVAALSLLDVLSCPALLQSLDQLSPQGDGGKAQQDHQQSSESCSPPARPAARENFSLSEQRAELEREGLRDESGVAAMHDDNEEGEEEEDEESEDDSDSEGEGESESDTDEDEIDAEEHENERETNALDEAFLELRDRPLSLAENDDFVNIEFPAYAATASSVSSSLQRESESRREFDAADGAPFALPGAALFDPLRMPSVQDVLRQMRGSGGAEDDLHAMILAAAGGGNAVPPLRGPHSELFSATTLSDAFRTASSAAAAAHPLFESVSEREARRIHSHELFTAPPSHPPHWGGIFPPPGAEDEEELRLMPARWPTRVVGATELPERLSLLERQTSVSLAQSRRSATPVREAARDEMLAAFEAFVGESLAEDEQPQDLERDAQHGEREGEEEEESENEAERERDRETQSLQDLDSERYEEREGEGEDGSHSTITFLSRAPTSTTCNVSMRAVQDPNPRTFRGNNSGNSGVNSGEGDSVAGGPIPPLIEIDSPDVEANEELSVLTGHDTEGPPAGAALGMSLSVAEDDLFTVEEEEREGEGEGEAEDVSVLTLPQDTATATASTAMAMMDVEERESERDVGIAERERELAELDEIENDVDEGEDEGEGGEGEEREPRGESDDEDEDGPPCPPGYDEDVFLSLPLEMRLEVVAQHNAERESAGEGEREGESLQALVDAAGLDLDTLLSLPDDIREEVLDQARAMLAANTASAASAAAGDAAAAASSAAADNAAFLASLSPELRADVLLGADNAFLDTLPAEVAAEAQQLRERAASQWQRRELLGRMMHGGGEDENALAAALHAARGGGAGAAFPSDSDDEREREEAEHALELRGISNMLRRRPALGRTRNAASSNAAGAASAVVVRDRMMTLRKGVASKAALPPFLLAALARLLLSPARQPRVFADLVLRCAAQLCRSGNNAARVRDVFLRLLTALLTQDEPLCERALRELCPQSRFEGERREIAAHAASGDAANNAAVLSRVALFRLLHVLAGLARESEFAYESLVARDARAEPLGAPRGETSRSLFEALLCALQHLRLAAQSGAALEQAARLLELLSRPLESLPASGEEEQQQSGGNAANNATNAAESAALEPPQPHQPIGLEAGTGESALSERERETESEREERVERVRVPEVRLSRDSLSALCDALLCDDCGTNAFVSLSAATARLARVETNAFILRDLLINALRDAGAEAAARLDAFTQYLLCVQRDAVAAAAAAAHTTRSHNDALSLPALVPWGELGGLSLSRVQRTASALRALRGTARGERETAARAADELVDTWAALDRSLCALRAFYAAEHDESERERAARAAPQQTTLLSALRRLQPIAEAFLSLHTAELYENGSGTSGGGEESGEAANAAALAQQQPPPGQRFRSSDAYRRANLSLFSNESGGECGQSGGAMRRQLSLQPSQSLPRTHSALPLSQRAQRLLGFAQSHRALLNELLRSRPALLSSGALSPLVEVVQLRPCLSFENKRRFFRDRLRERARAAHNAQRVLRVQVRRSQVFEDSFQQLRARRGGEWRGARLQISFYGEDGIDAGGLTREWFSLLAREMFDANYALFTAAADGATFQPNPLSMINSNHLDYFTFVGRVIGKAVCDEQLMDAHFTRSFYKHVLGMPIDFHDIESTEPDFYKSLKMMLEHPLEALGFSGLTFTAEIQRFGRTEDIDLVPNGSQIAVTDENKLEYVRLIAHHRMTTAISAQIDAFLGGFYDVVPPELICIFSPAELELLVCGLPDVNVDELRTHTEYNSYRATDENIVWFWQALQSFDREERAAFLQFITGTSKVPLGGFANLQGMRGTQKFSIQKAFGGENGTLPSAHTCYNQLDLPVYQSAEELREKLLLAIKEGAEGFGLA